MPTQATNTAHRSWHIGSDDQLNVCDFNKSFVRQLSDVVFSSSTGLKKSCVPTFTETDVRRCHQSLNSSRCLEPDGIPDLFKKCLGMRPRNDFKTTLIAYASSDPQTYMPFVQDIRTFLYFYEEVNIQPQDGFATCDKIKSPDDVDLVCKFYPHDMGVCVKENNFGYDRSQPCVIMKINKVYGWLPDIVNKTLSNNPLVRCHGQVS
ncbi:unnamed protein product [Schistosoma curassoni]|uniref:Sodium/potassium-transporting ATPase subunit beta n=1 Tax=Schistosoma curassoni TaxID=6186 RepID=A0A183KKY1_9TREM|nr:unnamed protein product [Schistosoma curassoni]